MKEIQLKIKELKATNSPDGFSMDKMNKQESLFDELTEMARNKKTLLGRIIKFSVADGNAVYVIDKINTNTVHLSWIDFCDGYCDRQFGQNGGNMRIHEATAYTNFEDTLFNLKKR